MGFSSQFFSPSGKKKAPSEVALFRIEQLSDHDLLRGLIDVAEEISLISKTRLRSQKKNGRGAARKGMILIGLFESLPSDFDSVSSDLRFSLNELRAHLERSRDLLNFCAGSSLIWLILKSCRIRGYFLELDQEICNLLEGLPFGELTISTDLIEQIELLRRQARRSIVHLDPAEDELRRRISAFIDDFRKVRIPDHALLHDLFVRGLRIEDGETCRAEIESLERHMCDQEEDQDELGLLQSAIALARYASFSLFKVNSFPSLSSSLSSSHIVRVPPEDLCCPISLELMRDPVVVSTGQTYERSSIEHWIEDGHVSCPKSCLPLRHCQLIPNSALKSLITGWCNANGAAAESPEPPPAAADVIDRAAIEANRATAKLLVDQLQHGGATAKTAAAIELRLLAKHGGENRAAIAAVGAIPLLQPLLASPDGVAQENAVTAILNLSILEENKALIMAQPGCLQAVVDVLVHGRTSAARENAAAALFSLSAMHEYKLRICDEAGAVEALAKLLCNGSRRGRKDAAAALFNLSTRRDCCERMLTAGAAEAMVTALDDDAVAEETAGGLALLLRWPAAVDVLAEDGRTVTALAALLARGSQRTRENAAAALLELCRGGRAEKVARVPAMAALLQKLHATGTKRARRKAAALARLCYRRRLGVDRRLGLSGSVSVALSVSSASSISVHVL